MEAASSVFWPTGELTGTSCKVDNAAEDGLLEASAGDKRQETYSATGVIKVSIHCSNNMDCTDSANTDSFGWVETSGSGTNAID